MRGADGSLLGPWFPETSHLQLLLSAHAPRKEDRHKTEPIHILRGPWQRIHSFCHPAEGKFTLIHKKKVFLWVPIIAISISFNKVLLARNADLKEENETLRSTLRLNFGVFLLALSCRPSITCAFHPFHFLTGPMGSRLALFGWRAAVFFPLDVIFPKPFKNVFLPSSDPFNGGSWPSLRCSVCGDPACDKVRITFIQLCIWFARKPRAKENMRRI